MNLFFSGTDLCSTDSKPLLGQETGSYLLKLGQLAVISEQIFLNSNRRITQNNSRNKNGKGPCVFHATEKL